MAHEFFKEAAAALADLGIEDEPVQSTGQSSIDERVIAGFEEIQQFAKEHGRAPKHGEDLDIFERIYAVRLDRLRSQPEYHALLTPFDHHNLLGQAGNFVADSLADMDTDELLEQLGLDTSDITELRHVRSSAEKRAAEDIAKRQKCEDFEKFLPLFEQVQQELNAGLRETVRFERKAEIIEGRFYILEGQKLFVATMGTLFQNAQGTKDARLRVIFDNGTESNLLMRSLQKALQQDPTGRRILESSSGPLFTTPNETGDQESGTIYVLRSKSDHPNVVANRDVIHKIGVTGGELTQRLANAKLDPTFLMAEVEVVSTYKLFNINRSRLENLIHRILSPAQLEIVVPDRFGNSVVPREWFLVPLVVIDEIVERIQDNSITNFIYDPSKAQLVLTLSR